MPRLQRAPATCPSSRCSVWSGTRSLHIDSEPRWHTSCTADVVMRRLLGLFRTREQGLRTLERLRAAGFEVQTIENPSSAAETSRDVSTHRERDGSTAAATGAVVGALAGGVVGAVPGALLGALAGHGLGDVNSRRY